MVKLTLIGGPTALLEFAGVRWLLDPAFSPPGEYGNGLRGGPTSVRAPTRCAERSRATVSATDSGWRCPARPSAPEPSQAGHRHIGSPGPPGSGPAPNASATT
jgi:hypothetical protein